MHTDETMRMQYEIKHNLRISVEAPYEKIREFKKMALWRGGFNSA